MSEQRTPEEIITALNEAKRLGLTVWLDNDQVSATAFDSGPGEDTLDCHPDNLLMALLLHFGVTVEHV